MNTVDAAISLLLALINNAAQVSALIDKAKSEGRTDLSQEDWVTILEASSASEQRLADAIRDAAP